MSTAIFNSNKTLEEYKNTPIFMGSEPGFMDTINKPYPKLWALYKELKSLDWDENEFDYSRCFLDFKNCHPDTADMMIETIGWQWEADSIASRSVLAIMSPFATSTEYWTALVRIADNECLTPDHEVYVQDKGWTPIANIKKGDIVIQYNVDGTMQYTSVLDTISKYYNDDIVKFNCNSLFSQSVTKKHRMPLYRHPNNRHEVYEAQDCPLNGSVKLINSGLLIGDNDILSPKERLWIAFQADGSYVSKKYNGGYTGLIPITFSFKKDRKKNELRNLLEQVGYDYDEYNLSREGYTKFVVKVPAGEYISNAKTFGWVDLSKVDHKWCASFIDEIAKWDGCIRKNKSKFICTYTSSNKLCVDTVVTIAAFAGFRTNVYTIKGCDNHKTSYQVGITNRSLTTGNSIKKTFEAYNGLVHCITVESGMFLTRHNDIISVTGNCIHGATYSEIVKLSFQDTEYAMNKIMSFKNTQARMKILEHTLGESLQLSRQYAAGLIPASDALYRDVPIKTTICLLFLERLQFMASFAVTFSICSTGLFQPIGKAVQKICQDEIEIHSEFDKEVILYELKTERGQKAMEELRPWMHEIAAEFIESEFDFIDSLYRDGRHLPGVTVAMLKEWVLYNAKDIIKFLKLELPQYNLPKHDPMPALETWIDVSKTQAAPQEEQIGQYKIGIVQDDAGDTVFDIDF